MASNISDESTSQAGSSDQRLTWESLKRTSAKCETLYQKVVDAVKNKSFLPAAGMSLLQHNLPTTDHSSVLHILERRLKAIKNRQVGIILAGQVDAGKSTFVNILMGGPYLPMDIFQTTKLVCELHHDDQEAKAVFKHQDRRLDNITLRLSRDWDSHDWQTVRRGIKEKNLSGNDSEMFSRVVIYWKLSLDNEETVPKQYAMQGQGALQVFIGQMSQPYTRRVRTTSSLTDAVNEKEVKQLFSPDAEHETEVKQLFSADSVHETEVKRPSRADDGGSRRHKYAAATGRCDRQISEDTESEDESRDGDVGRLTETVPDSPGVDEDAARGSNFVDSYIARLQDEYVESLEEPANNDTGGFSLVFLDCPGSLDNEESRRPILSNLVMCHTFIFIIDTSHIEHQSSLTQLMVDIENGLERQNAFLSPDNALFVFNKMDLISGDRSDEVTGKIVEMLKTRWHFISPDNVIRIQANQILEGATPRSREEKAKLLTKLQTFIRQSTLLTLEEHLLWLLDMTEVAWAMACRGKRLSKSHRERSLNEMQTHIALILQEIEQINDIDIVEGMQRKLSEVIDSHIESLDGADWASSVTNEIESATNGEDWKCILKRIDKIICEKLCSLLSEDTCIIRELQDEYNQKIDERFGKVLSHLKKVQKKMHGLLKNETNENGSILTSVLSMVSTGIIRAPNFTHFVFFVIPVLSLWLIGRSIYEEYQYFLDEEARQFFVAKTKDFLRRRANMLKKLSQSGDTRSSLFRHVFGPPMKEKLCEYTSEIRDAVWFVLEGSVRCNEEQKDTIGALMARAMKVYARHIMTMDIQASQLTWLYTRNDQLRKIIDSGNGSIVYEAKFTDRDGENVPVAVKEVRFAHRRGPEEFCKDVFKECLVLRRLSREQPHPNVIKFYGCDAKFGTDECHVRLVFDRCIGNLNVIISNKDVIASNKARDRRNQFKHYASDCAAGLCFLHEKHVLHRDVTPANYLLVKASDGDFYRVVISDMGSARNEDRVTTTIVGTPVYFAPEIARGRRFHSFESDIYSLGLVLWELWFRSPVHRKYSIDQGQPIQEFPSDRQIKAVVRTV